MDQTSIDAAKVVEIQKLLSRVDHDVSHSSDLTDRLASVCIEYIYLNAFSKRFEDYKNIYHDINPWLAILKDSLKQNLDVVHPLVQIAQAHGLLKAKLSTTSVDVVALSVLSRKPHEPRVSSFL